MPSPKKYLDSNRTDVVVIRPGAMVRFSDRYRGPFRTFGDIHKIFGRLTETGRSLCACPLEGYAF
jgi:hypothetical protein